MYNLKITIIGGHIHITIKQSLCTAKASLRGKSVRNNWNYALSSLRKQQTFFVLGRNVWLFYAFNEGKHPFKPG